MHPYYLTEKEFPFHVKIFHAMTGHIYIRPINNLKPFSSNQELEIQNILLKLGIGTIRNKVTAKFTTEETAIGYGFRLYQETRSRND